MSRITLARSLRITAGETDHDHPVFSPDGRWVAFAAGEYGAMDLYLADRRGRFARRLTRSAGNETQASFAPDGSRIAYCAQAAPAEPAGPEPIPASEAPWEVFLLDLDPGARPARLLADANASYKQPVFSPDGRRIACFSDEGSPRNFHLFLLDLETGRRRKLTDERNRNDCHPAFAPDGRRIAFHAYEGLAADRANIYLIDSLDGSVARITDRPGLSKHPCFAGERTIVFHREELGESSALHAVDVTSGRETRLSPPGRDDKQPDVVRTKKGRFRIAFASREAGVAGAPPVPAGRGPAFDIVVARLRGVG